MPHPVMYSTGSEKGSTPWPVVEFAAEQLGGPFTLDAAASKGDAKVSVYFNKKQNALVQKWSGRVWLNPPYSRHMREWIEKAYQEGTNGNTELVCALLPARTDTRWWHDFVWKADMIIFFKGRITFLNAKAPAPYPSCLVVWKPTRRRWPKITAAPVPH